MFHKRLGAAPANLHFIRLIACLCKLLSSPASSLGLVLIKGEPHKYAAAYKGFPRYIKVTRKL